MLNSYLGNMPGIEHVHVMALGFCDFDFISASMPQQQSIQSTFSVPLAPATVYIIETTANVFFSFWVN